MAKGRNQRLRFKRRRNAETDYHRRSRMLRGGLPRAVVRVSNTQVTCQLVSYEPEGDRVLESITGKSLVDSHKWPSDASRKSVPACYLAGFAMATSAISNGHSKAILDIGLAASSTGNRAYSALKGMIDAGMEIPHSEGVLPSEERINGEHIGDGIAKAVAATKKSIGGGK
ncbi:MAG: 50S ribosomal protein L18 [Euryarchaeota archaeon]|jgi:large subunit ribosomal protein L18|nr:50S ribosomal protein L18 [Euryarchaeota archaeon]MED6346363.1 50S ribosomal protein L18 [Candidatus Thermoplasmatota archaeon]|tara:strand:+ start:128 stop:640 length:513 start_codon:yes stop_codon:yes gene_type:complete